MTQLLYTLLVYIIFIEKMIFCIVFLIGISPKWLHYFIIKYRIFGT